ALRGDGPHPRGARAQRRMLRLRGELLLDGGRVVVAHGRRPRAGFRTRRRAGRDVARHVVPDAPLRPISAAAPADRVHAHRRGAARAPAAGSAGEGVVSAGASPHWVRAEPFLADAERARFHDRALWQIRRRRDQRARALPEWEALRALAAQIKAHTLSRLPEYLLEFEANAREHGAVVHFAADAAEHNRIVLELLRSHGVERVVKSK